jgi:hypothetical protein
MVAGRSIVISPARIFVTSDACWRAYFFAAVAFVNPVLEASSPDGRLSPGARTASRCRSDSAVV